jgi:RNase P/RNase MRP subunit p29
VPKHSAPPNPLSVPEREALAGELIGAAISVRAAPGVRDPVAGTIVDETLSTFVVELAGRSRTVRLAKRGLDGAIVLEGRELPLRGDLLRVRPEDRTKRLLAGGPRRYR